MFDAVVMLTWSNWKTEPRSNRYHYASRFASSLPVFFVQPNAPLEDAVVEATEIENLRLVHLGDRYEVDDGDLLDEVLAAHGVRNPLIWVYNPYFEHIIARRNNNCIVYHATEAYLIEEGTLHSVGRPSELRPVLLRTLQHVDLLVSVSDDVERSYVESSAWAGHSITLRNGCDFGFWFGTSAFEFRPQESGRPVALYQGGVNNRLDYGLISALVEAMPDWDFWFCGKESAPAAWKKIKSKSNVKYLGVLDPDGIASVSRNATVGLLPFLDQPIIRASLPLKAFEYVACGLPVVSVPINELAKCPEIFEFATTAAAFAARMRSVAASRSDAAKIDSRLRLAATQSYDERFAQLVDKLEAVRQRPINSTERMNLLVLYDDRSTHVSTISEHLESFSKYSRHRVFYLPCTGRIGSGSRLVPDEWDLSLFDAVIVHYCVRLSVENHINFEIAKALRHFAGAKVLFIQDEYDTTETARRAMEFIQFDLVFTCVPRESIGSVYPAERFSKTEFVETLTGYVPEGIRFSAFVRPMAERNLRIAYRGRDLPYQYGDLAREKYQIGLDVKRFCQERGIPADIEVTSAARIYGTAWYRFLASARSTLGTESGSNVFDFDGSLAKLAHEKAEMPYEAFHRDYLAAHEGKVRMNQISPKIFEAIALRTALVLFEGSYSGVVEAHKHYIPLKKDYSNIDDVLARLEDVPYLEAMTERAYSDIIGSGSYSYRRFVADFEKALDRSFYKPARARFLATPSFVLQRGRGEKTADSLNTGEFAYLLSDTILTAQEREEIVVATRALTPTPTPLIVLMKRAAYDQAKAVWRLIPWRVRRHLVSFVAPLVRR